MMTDESAPPRTLSDALRRRRDRLGMSQDEVAKRLDTIQPTYQRWEAGTARPTKEADLRRLADHLEMDARDVLELIYLPGNDVPDRVDADQLREVVEGLAEAQEQLELETGVNNARDEESLARLTLRRVRKIEVLFQEVTGESGRLAKLEEMMGELRAAQETMAAQQQRLAVQHEALGDLTDKLAELVARLEPPPFG